MEKGGLLLGFGVLLRVNAIKVSETTFIVYENVVGKDAVREKPRIVVYFL